MKFVILIQMVHYFLICPLKIYSDTIYLKENKSKENILIKSITDQKIIAIINKKEEDYDIGDIEKIDISYMSLKEGDEDAYKEVERINNLYIHISSLYKWYEIVVPEKFSLNLFYIIKDIKNNNALTQNDWKNYYDNFFVDSNSVYIIQLPLKFVAKYYKKNEALLDFKGMCKEMKNEYITRTKNIFVNITKQNDKFILDIAHCGLECEESCSTLIKNKEYSSMIDIMNMVKLMVHNNLTNSIYQFKPFPK